MEGSRIKNTRIPRSNGVSTNCPIDISVAAKKPDSHSHVNESGLTTLRISTKCHDFYRGNPLSLSLFLSSRFLIATNLNVKVTKTQMVDKIFIPLLKLYFSANESSKVPLN